MTESSAAEGADFQDRSVPTKSAAAKKKPKSTNRRGKKPKPALSKREELVGEITRLVQRDEAYLRGPLATLPDATESKRVEALLQTLRDDLQADVRELVGEIGNLGSDAEKQALRAGEEMHAKLEARLRYLQDFQKQNPFTVKQAYVSKRLDVQAALLVLDGYLQTPNLSNQQINRLQSAQLQLNVRLKNFDARMKGVNADQVIDPESILGPPGATYEAKTPVAKVMKAKGAAIYAVGKVKDESPLTSAGRKELKRQKKHKREKNQITGMLKQGSLAQVPLDSAAINENDVMRKFLVATLKQADLKSGAKQVNAKQAQQHVKARNGQDWNTIERNFVFRNEKNETIDCIATITPAAQLGPDFADLQGHGVCSHDTKSYKHATTLCKTEVKVGGKPVFAGLRHGINSARGIKEAALRTMPDAELKDMVKELLVPYETFNDNKDVDQRAVDLVAKIRQDDKYRERVAKDMKTRANASRARDMIKAAGLVDPKKVQEAYNAGKPLKISISSVSLMTPGMGMEGDMIADQREGWAEAAKTKKMKFTVKNTLGQLVEKVIDVEVEVNSFNFGVNAMAFGSIGEKGKVGWADSDKNVDMPLTKLIGAKSEGGNGGQVKAWLDEVPKRMRAMALEKPSAEHGVDRIKEEMRELDRQKSIVEALAKDVYEMWNSEEYRTAGTAPYKMPSRVAMLAQKIGQVPCFNCKSGKDRTSMMDVECKLLATQIAVDGKIPPRNPVHNDKDVANRANVAMNAGNFEVQQLNAGHMGYKVGGVDKALGDKDTNRDFHGTSKHTDKYSAG